MALWLVRAGKGGIFEDFVLEKSVASIGFDPIGDLSTVHSKESLKETVIITWPEKKPQWHQTTTNQLWAFRDTIKVGDAVVLPRHGNPFIALGIITGSYSYRPDNPEGARHIRPVEWRVPEYPRASVSQGMRFSLGTLLTVCTISKNNAEGYFKSILGLASAGTQPPPNNGTESLEEMPNLEEAAIDQIVAHIRKYFKGHDLARLVDAILQAQGYHTHLSPPGPDGGVDIQAGFGPLGFGAPRLLVQVKSSENPMDVHILRELLGIMKKYGADQGLLVAWGGFKGTLEAEARQSFFHVRLWSSEHILRAVFENYERLPADVRSELPLTQIWTLVVPEDD